MKYSNFFALASLLILGSTQAQAQARFIGKNRWPLMIPMYEADSLPEIAAFGIGFNIPNAYEASQEKALDITSDLTQDFSIQTFPPQRALLGAPDLNLNTHPTSVVTVPTKSRALALDDLGTNLTVVAPEPSAWLLIGIGLPALLGAARLRKRMA